MGRPSVEEDKSLFLHSLEQQGGSAGNVTLKGLLQWDDDRYWRTHGLLADEGGIIRGRGKGGSVSLVPNLEQIAEADVPQPTAEGSAPTRVRELDLYEQVKATVQSTWVKERAFDDHVVEITGLPGRKNTGGTWTRPDVSVLASKAYPYLPDRVFEIITFEVKTADAVNVTGVFEALSHSQFATLSYVLFCTNGADFDKGFSDTQRLLSIATQHGIGVIIAVDLNRYDTWDERVRPRRNVPDPEQANLFISTCFSELARSTVVKWHK